MKIEPDILEIAGSSYSYKLPTLINRTLDYNCRAFKYIH